MTDTPWRVYGLDRENTPVCLSECDDVSLADSLLDLRKQGRIADGTRVGIMYRPDPELPGEWIVNPYARR